MGASDAVAHQFTVRRYKKDEKTLRVLVVEDEAKVAGALQEGLERERYL
jgi:hypothetical protein